jgi:hypothetical protein
MIGTNPQIHRAVTDREKDEEYKIPTALSRYVAKFAGRVSSSHLLR